MIIHTIGFTKKGAQTFFELLKTANVKQVVDVRLNNSSQLAGFAKRDDLKYFLEKFCNIKYFYEPLLAPTKEMLDEYKKNGGNWETYEARFTELMIKRKIEDNISKDMVDQGCLLCSEDKPHNCHRRIVAEYFRDRWAGETKISHLT